MKIILYGVLAELAEQKIIETALVNDVHSLRLLMDERFPAFQKHRFQVAVNRRNASDDQLLSEQDEIALLPPFAGG